MSHKYRRVSKKRIKNEIGDFDVSIAKYIVPRLKVFILEKDTRPQELTKDEWNEVLKYFL